MIKGYARIVAITSMLFSIVCVGILHVVRPDLPPLSHRLSEYASGPYGWMMTTAFTALGCGFLAGGMALRASGKDTPWIARIIPATAFVASTGTFVSGAFRAGATHSSNVIHSRASAVAVVAVVGLALAFSMNSMSRRSDSTHDLLATSLALIGAALAAVSPLLHETRWTGLSQRLLWTALIAWMLRATWHERRVWGNDLHHATATAVTNRH